MKKEYWLPSVVFLVASIPTVYFLQYMGWGGDYVLLLAMGAGALATGLVLPRLRKPTEGDARAQANLGPISNSANNIIKPNKPNNPNKPNKPVQLNKPK